MSSTSSSDRVPRTRSATEALASRYRHLFVLPSAPILLLYGGLASFALCLISRGLALALPFATTFVVFVLSAAAISSAMRIMDRKTIATFRRAQATLLAGIIIWLLVAAAGAVYSYFSGSSYSLTNALLFGAFVSAGFEFLIIHGAFSKSAGVSLILAVLHPGATLVIIRFQELASRFDPIAAVTGAAALGIFVAFPLFLKQRKTTLGHDALSLFQAFMKTWAAGYADELEGIISDHSEETDVTTKVLRFRTPTGDTFLVLPGVHPGPFHPLGSYDLPGVMSRAFKGLGPVMTLHRPGGHERNLATRAETLRYASEVSEFAESIVPGDERASMRGPVHGRVGGARVAGSAFGDDLIMTMSFAPLGSDDLDTRVESELAGPATKLGLQLSVVDAHNSIDPRLQSPTTEDPGWTSFFEEVRAEGSNRFSFAYSNSGEVGFSGKGDMTENGMSLFMVQSGGSKSALVLADANNSVPELSEQVRASLSSFGYALIEFCTSDSHNLAARGLTVERGYEALGEATPPSSIAEASVKMAKLAEGRLAQAQYGSMTMKSRVRVFGARALEEFAGITQASSKFSRAYLRFAAVSMVFLMLATLIF